MVQGFRAFHSFVNGWFHAWQWQWHEAETTLVSWAGYYLFFDETALHVTIRALQA